MSISHSKQGVIKKREKEEWVLISQILWCFFLLLLFFRKNVPYAKLFTFYGSSDLEEKQLDFCPRVSHPRWAVGYVRRGRKKNGNYSVGSSAAFILSSSSGAITMVAPSWKKQEDFCQRLSHSRCIKKTEKKRRMGVIQLGSTGAFFFFSSSSSSEAITMVAPSWKKQLDFYPRLSHARCT